MTDHQLLSQLSSGERLYYRPDATMTHVETEVITLPSRINDLIPEIRKAARIPYDKLRHMTPKAEWEKQIEERRQKRKADTIAYNQRMAEEKAVEVERTRVFRHKQRQLEIAEKSRRKVEKECMRLSMKSEKKGPDAKNCKIPVTVFEPVIGKINIDGEIPVRVDHKTVIMVGAGRDVQEAIRKYQNYLYQKR